MYIIRNGKETRKRGKKRPGYIIILLYIVAQDVLCLQISCKMIVDNYYFITKLV